MRFLRRHLDVGQLGLSVIDHADAATAAHLASCAACRRRQARLARRLAASRAGAHAAADAAFPPEVLDRQRSAILQRIARVGAGRVIAFPRSQPPADAATGPIWRGHERRWIAAAAAAGLLVGFMAGQWPGADASPTPAAVAVVTPSPAEALRRDDTLLSDVEEALSREVRPEFGALDGLTPIAYETR